MYRWVVKDNKAVSTVPSANQDSPTSPRSTERLKVPLIRIPTSESVEYSKCTSNGLGLLRPADQPYALPLVTAATTDEQLFSLTEMDYDHSGSRQSKSGYVRAVTNRYRTPYSDVQKGILETAYIQNWGFITIEKKRYLARQLGLTERQIKVWFQNRRARDRRENKRKVQERRLFGRGELDKESQNGVADDDFDDDADSTEMVIDESANEYGDDEMEDGATYDHLERTPSEPETPPEKIEFAQSRHTPPATILPHSPAIIPKRKLSGKSSRKDYEPKRHHIEGLAEAMNIKHQTEEAQARREEKPQFLQKELINLPSGIKIKEEKEDYEDFPAHRFYEKSGAHDLDTYHAELVRQMTLRNFYEHVSNWVQQSDDDVTKARGRNPKDHPLDWQRSFEKEQMTKALQLQSVLGSNFHIDGLANLKEMYHRNLNGAIKNGSIPAELAAQFGFPPHFVMRERQLLAQMANSEFQDKVTQPRPSDSRSMSTSPLQAQEPTKVADIPPTDVQESVAPLDLSTKSKTPPQDDKPMDVSTDDTAGSTSSLVEHEEEAKSSQSKRGRIVNFLWRGKCTQGRREFYDTMKL